MTFHKFSEDHYAHSRVIDNQSREGWFLHVILDDKNSLL